MAKAKTVYTCQNCGQSYPRWSGQCQSCGEWNTLVEEVVAPTSTKSSAKAKKVSDAVLNASVVTLASVDQSEIKRQRTSTQISELDRVLGGEGKQVGLVPGAVILLGGEPGIGKSTLLTQLVLEMSLNSDKDVLKDRPFLYLCGEESPAQITLRLERLVASSAQSKQKTNQKLSQLRESLQFITTTDVDEVAAIIEKLNPLVVIIDSIQTLTTTDLSGAAGSVGQVRESAERLRTVAKRYSIPLFLVGHVTKDGTISGPKILEHIVDAVLELSGERTGDLRLLRSLKNRFGATDEVGVFRVTSYGYESVENPHDFFLEHSEKPVAGSATVCVMEGTRPLLVEIQALVVSSQLAMPRRVGRGIELSRIQVLAAVLQKHAKLPLGTNDIFVSAAGGFTVKEPAVDLGVAVAVASSLRNKALPAQTVCIGEVGLLGEIRGVNYLDRRIKEAKRLGFEHIISRKSHRSVVEVLQQFSLK